MDKSEGDDASSRCRELVRYERGLEKRVYELRVVASGAQLWRITAYPGEPTQSIKEADVASMEETLDLIEEIGRALTAAGWKTGA